MTVFHESLEKNIRDSHLRGQKLGTIVVHVTEIGKKTNTKSNDQKHILQVCNELKIEVWFMQMNVLGDIDSQADLVALIDKTRLHQLRNDGNNIFQGSTLAKELKSRQIEGIVMMGEELRSCIRMSIKSTVKDKQGDAAIDFGLTVMTSPLILRGGSRDDVSEISTLAVNEPHLLWYTKL